MIIEVDGYSHFVKSEEDYQRELALEELGYRILRFSESMVVYRIDEVVAEIEYAMECIEEDMRNSGEI